MDVKTNKTAKIMQGMPLNLTKTTQLMCYTKNRKIH